MRAGFYFFAIGTSPASVDVIPFPDAGDTVLDGVRSEHDESYVYSTDMERGKCREDRSAGERTWVGAWRRSS